MLHFDSLNEFWPSPIQPMHRPNPCPAFRGWGWVRSSLRVSRRERSKLLLPPRRFAPAGLILTHRCNLSLLLFHSHRSLPMRGYHSSLLYLGFLTLPFHLSFPTFSSIPAHTFPPLYSLLLYSMPVQLHYIQLCRLRDPRQRLWRHVIKKIIIVYLILWTFLSRDLSHF